MAVIWRKWVPWVIRFKIPRRYSRYGFMWYGHIFVDDLWGSKGWKNGSKNKSFAESLCTRVTSRQRPCWLRVNVTSSTNVSRHQCSFNLPRSYVMIASHSLLKFPNIRYVSGFLDRVAIDVIFRSLLLYDVTVYVTLSHRTAKWRHSIRDVITPYCYMTSQYT